MDDAWGDLFAKAEGSTDVSLTDPREEPRAEEELQQEHSRKRKRRKKSNQNSSSTEQKDAFQAMLESRMEVPQEDSKWPEWILRGNSLGKFSSSCQQSALQDRVHVADHAKAWPLEVFCHLRNIRCTAKLWIWHPNTKAKRVLRGLQEELHSLQNKLSLANRSLAPSEASIVVSKAQRLASAIHRVHKYSFETLVRIIIASDEVYYRLYYLQITQQLAPMKCGGGFGYLPHPQHYFGLDCLTADSNKESDISPQFLDQLDINQHDKSSMEFLWQRVGLVDIPEDTRVRFYSDQDSHPLLALRRYRFLETVALFCPGKWPQMNPTKQELQQSLERPQNVNEEEEDEETPAPRLLMEWRDSCRDFLCHLYAYATLSTTSLQAIHKFLLENNLNAGILEYGAGTGYLARVLRDDYKIAVVPVDVCPTGTEPANSPTATSTLNDFHGLTPCFSLPVHPGSVDAFQKNLQQSTDDASQVALMLCYPPPRSSMAFDVLKAFVDNGGKAFIHIGEFKGLTGNKAFEKLLRKKFECQERFPCLSWGTDASEVSLWMRRESTPKDEKKKKKKAALLPCSFCGKVDALRRCRLLRYLVYCSENCCQKDTSSREKHLAMNMIELGEFALDYQNEKHFSVLS